MAVVDGRSLELYFIEGKPDGMLTAEVFNWTGHVLVTPRTRISAALSRKEASYTGVYLLLGEQEGEPTVYIGEGEDIGERIRSHDIRKDWWTQAVLITTTANNLNKAHVKYLESRLVEDARRAKSFKIDNANTPPRPSLAEASLCNMEGFLSYVQMVLPALRVDVFITNTRPTGLAPTAAPQASEPRFRLTAKKYHVDATAVLRDGDFIVEAGSTARDAWIGALKTSGYALLFERLQKTGILGSREGHCVFTQNYAFSSPSAAAAVVLGRSANGTTEWRIDGGTLDYKGWEERQIEQEMEKAS